MKLRYGLFLLMVLIVFQFQSYAGIPMSESQPKRAVVEKVNTPKIKKKKVWKKKSFLNKIKTKTDIGENKTAAIVFAILLPPVGVAIYQDGITSDFWITCLLWVLGILPGIIYALTIVLKRY